jgi:hypothetical protein
VPATVERMRTILADVRDRGYAVEAEEEDAGIGCIAAPFFDGHGQVAGSGRRRSPLRSRSQSARLSEELTAGH